MPCFKTSIPATFKQAGWTGWVENQGQNNTHKLLRDHRSLPSVLESHYLPRALAGTEVLSIEWGHCRLLREVYRALNASHHRQALVEAFSYTP